MSGFFHGPKQKMFKKKTLISPKPSEMTILTRQSGRMQNLNVSKNQNNKQHDLSFFRDNNNFQKIP